ncbi:hypothetical protein H0H92_002293 [Tricholoma furcatifolium]|nr:hypothetical protein H0H92_002293 [Tricholoma furcatifolium]
MFQFQENPAALFAVIIGIDRYDDIDVPDLSGAVADADAINEFLLRIHVSQNRIVNLRDEEATRKAILQALRDIATNDVIGAQDPILIYFAGLGSETHAPSTWTTSASKKTIQMILPCDFISKGSQHDAGQGIFDMDLIQIFYNISRKKSDNITVVFDCCHSGSGSRNPNDQTLLHRCFAVPFGYAIPGDVCMPEVEYRDEGFASHILLAACKHGQHAMESHGRGVFTEALIILLQREGIKLTYKDIIAHLPDLPMQNPQCVGINQDRMLFNSTINDSRPPRMYGIQSNPNQKDKYILSAGEAHGVMDKAEFSVYYDTSMTTSIGSVVVTTAHAHTSQCSAVNGTSFLLSQPAYAVQTRVGKGSDLRVFVPYNTDFQNFHLRSHEEMGLSYPRPAGRFFHLVDGVDEHPDLILDVHDGLVSFEIRDPICRQYDLTHMSLDDIPAHDFEHLLSVLRNAAYFYCFLRHSRKDTRLIEKVQLECLELEPSGELTSDLEEVFVPKSGGGNLIIGGRIILKVDEDIPYGFRITNSSNIPLHAIFLYLGINDLSIHSYCLPTASVSLPASGELNIGFGNSVWPARAYFLLENRKVDVGFIKLYISTIYMEFSTLPDSLLHSPHLVESQVHARIEETCEAFTIPVIQRL